MFVVLIVLPVPMIARVTSIVHSGCDRYRART